jgi:hypothetical protein
MWILKGTLLGLWLWGFGTMVRLYFAIYRNLPPNSAVDIRVITGYTIQNPFWWTALVVCLVLGYAIARAWSGPPHSVDRVAGDRVDPRRIPGIAHHVDGDVEACRSRSLMN